MGEVTPTPEVAARVIQDLTAVEVDPAKGERLYKAAIIRSKQGTTYRMLAKALKSGKLDIVHYGCDLDAEGNPTTKWAIRRILEQSPERFDREIASLQKAISDNGEELHKVYLHDMTGMADVAAQGKSLEDWSRKVASEIKGQA
jgi:hypothetical protein